MPSSHGEFGWESEMTGDPYPGEAVLLYTPLVQLVFQGIDDGRVDDGTGCC